jgi:hypothetical protein
MESLADQILRLNLSITNHPRGTDKNGPHSYIKHVYQPLIEIAQSPTTLLEIGSFGGASLVLWKSAFPQCEIIGFELDSLAELHPVASELIEGEGITLYYLDAYFAGFNLVKNQLFDLIIDDGPHTLKSQIRSLQFYDLLESDGTMVIEDLYHSFWTALAIWIAAPIRVKRNAVFINLVKYSQRKDDCVLLISKNRKVRRHFRKSG